MGGPDYGCWVQSRFLSLFGQKAGPLSGLAFFHVQFKQFCGHLTRVLSSLSPIAG